MGESSATRDWCRDLEQTGAMTYPLVAGRYTPSGWPDRLIHHREWQGLIEFKDWNTPWKPLQIVRVRELNRRVQGSAYFAVWHRWLPERLAICHFDTTVLTCVDTIEGWWHELRRLTEAARAGELNLAKPLSDAYRLWHGLSQWSRSEGKPL